MVQSSSAGFEAGDFALITINDIPVSIEELYKNKVEKCNYRGLHIVVINPSTGKVESANIFDTYKSSFGLDAFIGKGVPDGYIVCAACKDECTMKLSHNCKKWFASMGSREIFNVRYRQSFAFIGVSNRKEEVHEKRGKLVTHKAAVA